MVKDTSRRRAVAILLALAVLTLVLRLHFISEPLTMDTAVYGYISHALVAGEELYSGVWDHKPPGVYQLFMLSELLFGYGPKGMAYTGVIFTLASLLFIYLFLKEVSGRLAGLIGAGFWALASNSVLLQANENNVEVFLNTFTLIAIWSFVRSRASSAPVWLLVTGLSFALASLLKTIAVFPLISVALYAMISPCSDEDSQGTPFTATGKIRTLVYLLLPGALLWAVVFFYFALLGRFSDFWQSVFVFNAGYSGSILSNVWSFIVNPAYLFHEGFIDIWFLVVAAIAWIFISKKEYASGRITRGFFIILFFGLVVELSSPGKYFRHYYQLLFPLIAILAALFFTELRERKSIKKSFSGKLLFAVLIVATFLNLAYYHAGYFVSTPYDISRIKHGTGAIDVVEIAEFVRERTSECEKIYVWGGEAGIYYYSKRQSSSGVFFIFPLYFDSLEGRNEKIDRIYWDIIKTPPALFIRSKGYPTYDTEALFRFVESRYRVIKSFGDLDIYELIDREGKAECGAP